MPRSPGDGPIVMGSMSTLITGVRSHAEFVLGYADYRQW